MRKITDFIINQRNKIFIVFIILTVIAAVLSTKVIINDDITKYLPSTSETRIGMDIMENRFSEIKTSTLNIMLKGLNEEGKNETLLYLKNMDGVKSVSYDETEEYNKEDYTLYIITVDDKKDSELAKKIYQNIKEHFKNDELFLSGEIDSSNKAVLPMWIMVVAVVFMFLILTLMCESYLEPVLFLLTILMAIILNKGTNIMFGSVSNVTESITAILQMALSMDYSIMLIDRYRQEKRKENDKVKAMKNSLYKAFSAISSSSVTTIVGLLALVFMSFTIGRDMGLVLAKGVLWSLICIFFVLPTLILLFDKGITKTSKKVPYIKLDKVGKISFKLRYVGTILFVIIFMASYVLQGNLSILYTASQDDKISEIFSENNQMALIYKSEDEEKISNYLLKLEDNPLVDEVLGYGNTLNRKILYQELNEKIKDLDEDMDIDLDDYLIKILYYHYYNPLENNRMNFLEFVRFMQKEVYTNSEISDEVSEENKKDIDRLENFTNHDLIRKKRDEEDISELLEIDDEDIRDLFIYYASKNNDVKLNLPDYVEFMQKDVLTNKKYSKNINEEQRKSFDMLLDFTNKKTITKNMTSQEMARLFGMEENVIDKIYLYYIRENEMKTNLSMNEFTDFVLKEVSKNKDYATLITSDVKDNLELLNLFSDKDVIEEKKNAKEIAELFGMEENIVKLVINENEITLLEFANILLENSDTLGLDNATKAKLELLSLVMENTLENKKYSYQELAKLTGIDKEMVRNIYVLYTSSNSITKISPEEFVKFLLKHQDDELLKNSLDNNIKEKLILLQEVMQETINNKKYNPKELSELLGIEESDLELLFGLYSYTYVEKHPKVSLEEFVEFLLDDVLENEDLESNFDKDAKDKLYTIEDIMEGSLDNKTYNKEELYETLNTLGGDLDKDLVDLLYIYYGSVNEYHNEWTITIEKLIDYLNENILNDSRFDEFINEDMKKDIKDAKDSIEDAKDILIGDGYSRAMINTKLPLEGEETFQLVETIKNAVKDTGSEFYLIGDSPMALEMSKTFKGELNFITILTMLAIFIVVAITFKSPLISLILVMIIQCAVYLTMGILSFSGMGVYFIALLVVQSILMGATIDYAILFTTFYLENRKTKDKKEAIISSYNKSINTILTSSSILILVTFVVGLFGSGITSQICMTLSKGTICATLLILILLPCLLVTFDRIVIKKKKE